jgi:hypothetical protein
VRADPVGEDLGAAQGDRLPEVDGLPPAAAIGPSSRSVCSTQAASKPAVIVVLAGEPSDSYSAPARPGDVNAPAELWRRRSAHCGAVRRERLDRVPARPRCLGLDQVYETSSSGPCRGRPCRARPWAPFMSSDRLRVHPTSTVRRGSVFSRTSWTDTPGASSTRCRPSCSMSMTARSVMMRRTTLSPVYGREQFSTIL